MASRVGTKEEFDYFRKEALDTSPDWVCGYDKHDIQVFLKDMNNSHIARVKARGLFPNVTPECMYSVLMHDEYVRHIDTNMAEWTILEEIDQSNDISYYASKLPSLISLFISPRDFISHRSYGQTGKDEYMIILRSIEDERRPPRKKWIRANIIITGYLLRRHPNGVGTELIYLSQTDLKGKIPAKVINFSTSKLAPSLIRQFETDAMRFPEWEKVSMKTKTLPIYPAYQGAEQYFNA